MDVLRRNTDYALRAMVSLATRYGAQPLSTREMAEKQDIPYQLACKLMQKLHHAGFVNSFMGPQGGFELSKEPSKISIRQIIEAIQGPVSLNRCVLGDDCCPVQLKCPISDRLKELQGQIDEYLDGVTLEQLLSSEHAPNRRNKEHSVRRRK